MTLGAKIRATKSALKTYFDTLYSVAGAIFGSTGSTDNRVLRSDGTGGKTVQQTGVTIDDDDNMTVPGSVTTPTVTAGASTDLTVKMGDAVGTNKVSFTDSADAEVASINSDGELDVNEITTDRTSPAVVELHDSACTDNDINASIETDATDTGSGTEDVDVLFKQQIAGTLTTFMKADADGNIDFQSRNLVTTGSVSGGLPRVVKAATGSLSAADMRGCLITNKGQTDDAVVSLPAVFEGAHALVCLETTVAKYFRLDPDASEVIIFDGTTLTGGYYVGITSAVDGAMLSVVARYAETTLIWDIKTISETWVAQV